MGTGQPPRIEDFFPAGSPDTSGRLLLDVLLPLVGIDDLEWRWKTADMAARQQKAASNYHRPMGERISKSSPEVLRVAREAIAAESNADRLASVKDWHSNMACHRNQKFFGTRWLACVCPCQRLARHVTMAGA